MKLPVWTDWRLKREFKTAVERELARAQPSVEEAHGQVEQVGTWARTLPGPYAPRESHLTPTGELACPECGAPLVVRKAKRGGYRGKTFYGCTRYPACRGLLSRR